MQHLQALGGAGLYWGYIGIMENEMETTIVYWGYIGIMEKKMETTIYIIWKALGGAGEPELGVFRSYSQCLSLLDHLFDVLSSFL